MQWDLLSKDRTDAQCTSVPTDKGFLQAGGFEEAIPQSPSVNERNICNMMMQLSYALPVTLNANYSCLVALQSRCSSFGGAESGHSSAKAFRRGASVPVRHWTFHHNWHEWIGFKFQEAIEKDSFDFFFLLY